MTEKILNYPCRCGKILKESFCQVDFFGIDFGQRKCEVCTSCHSEYLDEDMMKEIEVEVKKNQM